MASRAQQSQSGWVSYAALDSPTAGVLREPARMCMTFWKGRRYHFSHNLLVISYDGPLGTSESLGQHRFKGMRISRPHFLIALSVGV